jgi:hypothetical protein
LRAVISTRGEPENVDTAPYFRRELLTLITTAKIRLTMISAAMIGPIALLLTTRSLSLAA